MDFKLKLPIMDNGIWWNGKPYEFSNLLDWNVQWTQDFAAHPEWYEEYGLKGHNGIDWAYKKGTPVVAPVRCYVQYVGHDKGYGNYARLYTETIDGCFLELVFAHFSELKVDKGKWIEEGTLIGLGGSTGNSTGNHLHLGIRPHITLPNGNTKIKDYNNGYFGYIDPAPFFPKTKWTVGELEDLNMTNVKILKKENSNDIFIGIPVREDFAMMSYLDNYGIKYVVKSDGSLNWDSISIDGTFNIN